MNRIKTLCRISNWVLAGATVLAGACFIAGCLIIYHSGDEQIYTPEKVAQTFAAIAVPIWLWLVLAAVRGILHILFPLETKVKTEIPLEMSLQRLQQRVDPALCPQDLQCSIQSLREDRKKDAKKGMLLLLCCSALFLFYGLDPSHYYADRINTAVITAACFLLICMSIPFFWLLGATKRAKHSMRIEMELLRSAPAAAKVTPPAPKKRYGVAAVRCVLLCAALGLLLYGFFAGGTADVLTKAVNICTECVGLG